MAKGKLSYAVKTFIVQSLASFDSPSVVAAAVRKEFGETITRQSVDGYDPTKRAGAARFAKWKALFGASREASIADLSEVGILHRSVRLRKLAHQVDANDAGCQLEIFARYQALGDLPSPMRKLFDASFDLQLYEPNMMLSYRGDAWTTNWPSYLRVAISC